MTTIFSIGDPKDARTQKRGVALLFAVLAAGILAALAASIFAVASRESVMASVSEDSVRAIIAAQSMAECLIYHDIRFGNFGSTSPQAFTCGGVMAPYTPQATAIPDGTSQLFDPSPAVGASTTVWYTGGYGLPCGDALMTKSADGAGVVTTRIWAAGRNNCLPGASRRLERGIMVRY